MAVKQIFFSYSFKDEDEVMRIRKIIESFKDSNGEPLYSVFMASDPIHGNKTGRSWNSQETQTMLKSFLIFFFLSDNSILSDGVSKELDCYFNS